MKSYTSTLVVGEQHTAEKMGSGDLPVLATPVMAALMENAAMNAAADEIPAEDTTVGGFIETSHLCPSAVGATVTATAELIKAEGKKLTYKITAREGDKVIGEGTHIRFVVNREKFMKKVMG